MVNLIKSVEKFIVIVRYEHKRYKERHEYKFDDINSLQKFINGDGYPSLSYYGVIEKIYSKIEYTTKYNFKD